jgi:hypothetical protein
MARNQKSKKNYIEELVILVHETPKPKYNWRKHLKPTKQDSVEAFSKIVLNSLSFIEKETGSISLTDVKYQMDLASKRINAKKSH